VSPQHRLAEITEAVAEARRVVAGGTMVDISGLDAAVTEICDAAQTLPADERQAFAGDLAMLAAALDQLAAEIVRQGEASRRRQANEAYGPEGSR
jgi:hypothetical protein